MPHFLQDLLTWSGEKVSEKERTGFFSSQVHKGLICFSLCLTSWCSHLVFLIAPEASVLLRICKFTSGFAVTRADGSVCEQEPRTVVQLVSSDLVPFCGWI